MQPYVQKMLLYTDGAALLHVVRINSLGRARGQVSGTDDIKTFFKIGAGVVRRRGGATSEEEKTGEQSSGRKLGIDE